jgi:hypothetical protein
MGLLGIRSHLSFTITSELRKKNKMKATYSTRTARREDAARIAVLGAHVWVHTYAAAGVSDVIAQYVLTTFTQEKILAVLSDSHVVLLVAEAEANLAGYIVMRLDSFHADVSIEIETLYEESDRHCWFMPEVSQWQEREVAQSGLRSTRKTKMRFLSITLGV